MELLEAAGSTYLDIGHFRIELESKRQTEIKLIVWSKNVDAQNVLEKLHLTR